MIEELYKLIDYIQEEYRKSEENWLKNENYNKINLKKKCVIDILTNEELMNLIFNYRAFLKKQDLSFIFDNFPSFRSKVNSRIKTENSTSYKITNYIKNHNNGKEPIIKCFNDLFGMRIICIEPLTYEQIKKALANKCPNLLVIDSSKDNGKYQYKATHIYFKSDNYYFRWELQVWNECNEQNNIISHKKYKEEYIKWEQENKGGV
ncbi:MAG: hypothetical protein IKF38_03425 [Clostridia bacterium]|nr:hypothetical protein [Clostridia bacterium]